MKLGNVFYVGQENEIGHHAAPLANLRDVNQEPVSGVLQQARPGDLAIFFSEHFHETRSAIRQLQESNVATLYAIDGILEWRNAWVNSADEPACPWTMRPALCHKVACMGPAQYRVLRTWGNQRRLEMVGLPRLDPWIEDRPSLYAAVDRWRVRQSNRVLVMTAKCPGFTPYQKATTVKSLSDLKNYFDGVTGPDASFQVTWRLTDGLADEIGVENRMTGIQGEELRAQIQAADFVVTTPSTAMVESMLEGRPVVMLDYHRMPHLTEAAWKIQSPEDITPCFDKLTNATQEGEADYARRMVWQETLLEDTLDCVPNATQRLNTLVDRMLIEAHLATQEKRPLDFSKPLLTQEDRQGPLVNRSVDFSLLYPGAPEFAECEPLVLQQQTAELRRHNQQLELQIAQLQKELSEAHGIFEQIHRHPIAGPVVRSRQKMLDWWHAVRQKGAAQESERATS